MKIDFEGAKLYVRPGATDLRKGVTGLLAIIENEMHLNALSNSVFFSATRVTDCSRLSSGIRQISGLPRKGLRWQYGHGPTQVKKPGKSIRSSLKCF